MSTKRHPGPFDCYAKLADDEPYFVLRAKDPIAPALVELWAALRDAQAPCHYSKLTEARECAEDMRRWRAAQVSMARGIVAMDKPPAGEDAALPPALDLRRTRP